MNPICPYCGETTKLVKGDEIYCGREALKDIPFYECLPCDAHVGCHKGTTNPMGSPANYELRKARNAAHKAFDSIWKNPKITKMCRADAYSWLSRQTRIPYKECHIGMMDVKQCNLTVTIVTQYKATWK